MSLGDAPRAGVRTRARVRLIAGSVLVGALVGGMAGIALAFGVADSSTARSVISVSPSSELFDDVAPATDDTIAVVQSELIILNGPALRDDVGRRVGADPSVRYSASQVGSSTIVELTAEASTRAGALRAVEAVVASYSEDRETRLRDEINRAAQVLDQELARLEQDLTQETLGAAALQQEYGRLLAVRSGLFRAAANADQAVTVVQPPVVAGTGLSQPVRYGALGALAGALLAVALPAFAAPRARTGVEEDFVGAGVEPLYPEMPRHVGPIDVFADDGPHAGAMRLLVAQLVRRQADGRALVLVGATPGVGTSYVAAAAAVSMAERSDVLLVLAADVVEGRDGATARALGVDFAARGLTTAAGRPLTAQDVVGCMVASRVPGVSVLARGPGSSGSATLRRLTDHGLVRACLDTGLAVVVDAPALAQSATSVDLAASAESAALVVGRGVTTRRHVEMVREVFDRQGVDLLGAVINPTGGAAPAAGARRARRGREGSPRAAAVSPAATHSPEEQLHTESDVTDTFLDTVPDTDDRPLFVTDGLDAAPADVDAPTTSPSPHAPRDVQVAVGLVPGPVTVGDLSLLGWPPAGDPRPEPRPRVVEPSPPPAAP